MSSTGCTRSHTHHCFDFDATTDGAERIDSLAVRARAITVRVQTSPVVVHMDWRPDNLRVNLDGTALVAIYDWESLGHRIEAVALGEVAAMHSIDFASAEGPRFATSDERIISANDAARARRTPYTPAEHAAVRAGIVYGWCYTARCEHARAAVNDDRPHFGMRQRLRTEGHHLLTTVEGHHDAA